MQNENTEMKLSKQYKTRQTISNQFMKLVLLLLCMSALALKKKKRTTATAITAKIVMEISNVCVLFSPPNL